MAIISREMRALPLAPSTQPITGLGSSYRDAAREAAQAMAYRVVTAGQEAGARMRRNMQNLQEIVRTLGGIGYELFYAATAAPRTKGNGPVAESWRDYNPHFFPINRARRFSELSQQTPPPIDDWKLAKRDSFFQSVTYYIDQTYEALTTPTVTSEPPTWVQSARDAALKAKEQAPAETPLKTNVSPTRRPATLAFVSSHPHRTILLNPSIPRNWQMVDLPPEKSINVGELLDSESERYIFDTFVQGQVPIVLKPLPPQENISMTLVSAYTSRAPRRTLGAWVPKTTLV